MRSPFPIDDPHGHISKVFCFFLSKRSRFLAYAIGPAHQGCKPSAKPDHYENLIIGSGEGGKYLAWHMARAGHRTAVVERKLIGGSCPNTNCLPSKNEIWSAKVAQLLRDAVIAHPTMAEGLNVLFATVKPRE